MKTVYQNCWDLFRAMLKEKPIASNGYTTKKRKKRIKTRDTCIYIKNLKNE